MLIICRHLRTLRIYISCFCCSAGRFQYVIFLLFHLRGIVLKNWFLDTFCGENRERGFYPIISVNQRYQSIRLISVPQNCSKNQKNEGSETQKTVSLFLFLFKQCLFKRFNKFVFALVAVKFHICFLIFVSNLFIAR